VPNLEEPVIARLRRHGRVLLLPALAFIGIVTAWGAVPPRLTELWQVVAFWIVTVGALIGLWIIPLVAWLGNRVVLTARRVIVHQGALVRSRQEIMLSRVHDVTVRQNAVQAVFGTGDVLLNTGAEKPVRLYDLPQANLVLSAINELVDAQAPLSSQLRRDNVRWGNTGAN
jgi:membrane protein YdbS with pleckstrin-like domain